MWWAFSHLPARYGGPDYLLCVESFALVSAMWIWRLAYESDIPYYVPTYGIACRVSGGTEVTNGVA
jgi:hypothetical protein